MGEKSTIREALEESRKTVRDAAIRAKEAVNPRIKAVREAADKLRDRIGPPRVDRAERTVHGRHGDVYEVQEMDRGAGQNGTYFVLAHAENGARLAGSFAVEGGGLTVRCEEGVPVAEIAYVAAAWLEPPAPTVKEPSREGE